MAASLSLNALAPGQLMQHILQHPGEECFRHVLALTGDYDFDSDGDVMLGNGGIAPNPANWGHFQAHIALNISVLKLDLATVRSFTVWTAIKHTAPAKFSLPQLHTLHISMDEVEEQIQFATRFLTPTLRDLSLLIFPRQRRMCYRSETPRYTTEPANELEEFLDDVAETWYPSEAASGGSGGFAVMQLFEAVQLCKAVQRLQFVVADVHEAYSMRDNLADMVYELPQLRTLVVARHTAVAPMLCLLSDHPALQSFGAYQAAFPPGTVTFREDPCSERAYGDFFTIWDACEDDKDEEEVRKTIREPVEAALTALTLEVDTPQFLDVARGWAADEVCFARVTQLHLHCSTHESGFEESEDEAHELLALLPTLFPALRSLRVGPLAWTGVKALGYGRTRRFAVGAPALRALAPLGALEELLLEAAYASCVSAAEWGEVLPAWPALRVLRLTTSQRLYVDAPAAPLDGVLRAFARHAPRVERLLLSVAPVVDGAAVEAPAALRELCLSHDYRVPDPAAFEACLVELEQRNICVMPLPIFHVGERPEIDKAAADFDYVFSEKVLEMASVTGRDYEDALAYYRSSR